MKEGLLANVSIPVEISSPLPYSDLRVAIWSVSDWTLKVEIWDKEVKENLEVKDMKDICDFSTKLELIVTFNKACVNMHSLSDGRHLAKCKLQTCISHLNIVTNPSGDTTSYFLVWKIPITDTTDSVLELRKIRSSDHTIVGADGISCAELDVRDVLISSGSVQVFGYTVEAFHQEFKGNPIFAEAADNDVLAKFIDLQFDMSGKLGSECIIDCQLILYEGTHHYPKNRHYFLGFGKTYTVLNCNDFYEIFLMERMWDGSLGKQRIVPRYVAYHNSNG